jgi:hypothetical protein
VRHFTETYVIIGLSGIFKKTGAALTAAFLSAALNAAS